MLTLVQSGFIRWLFPILVDKFGDDMEDLLGDDMEYLFWNGMEYYVAYGKWDSVGDDCL